MKYLDWHVGMRVVCIVSADLITLGMKEWPDANWVANNGIYTLREIRDDTKFGGKGIVVLLQEVDNSHLIGKRHGWYYSYVEPGFSAHGFRPLRERKTDISIFRAILNGTRISEVA